MTGYEWQTFYQHFPGDGSTPLVQNSLNLYTVPEGAQIRRTTFKTQLSVNIFSAGATGLPIDFSTYVTAAASLWLGNTAEAPATSPDTLAAADTTEWLFWDALQARVDSDAIVSTGMWRVIWETPPQGIDAQTRRKAVAGNSNGLWIGWEFDDPYGVINTSAEAYNMYLGGWFTVRFLIYTP